mmetsp:Transcript_2058/g.3639  ORF Transcript_2058/g.3639 Transcript_2058/m.3639 type:complete len:223 (+) Transcript_2058:602-1270(+)
MLKDIQIIKIYMKVNIYDPDNIQKGKLILLNLAEDLKSDCKMVVSPVKKDSDKLMPKVESPSKSLPSMEELEDAVKQSKHSREEFKAIELEDLDSTHDFENQPENLYMELKSTTSFKIFDIDEMLEHTTFDDFMKSVYMKRIADTKNKETKVTKQEQTEFEKIMGTFSNSFDVRDKSIKLSAVLDFNIPNLDSPQAAERKIVSESEIKNQIDSQALANLRVN